MLDTLESGRIRILLSDSHACLRLMDLQTSYEVNCCTYTIEF